jgi:uncharacterized membrane protein YqjE
MAIEADRQGGLLDSLKSLARNLLALAQTRLEILGNEIEEQRTLLVREALLGLAALFFVGLGIVFAAMFFLILFWDFRLLVAAIFALAFLGAGAIVLTSLRAERTSRPRSFSATVAELAKDRESLQ